MDKASSEDLHAMTAATKLAQMRRQWRLQHVGWAIVAVLVLAGAAGLFGSGPLSSTTRSVEGLTLEFDRFIRRGAPFTLKIGTASAPGQARAQLSLSRRYLDAIKISSMLPGPVHVVSGPDAIGFEFAVDAPVSVLAVQIHAEAIETGVLDGELAAGSARLPFTQFAWP